MKLEGNLNNKTIIHPLRFGMVQGRLIKSPMNLLQWFPQPYWEADFMIAGSLGFDYIELLAEREHNPMNPIWSEEGVERLKKVVDLANLTLPVFCNDYVIDNSNMTIEQYFNRGVQKKDSKDYYGAIEDFNEVLNIKSDYASALFQRAYSKFNLKDNYGAIADYTKVIELNPDYTAAYTHRGISKENVGDLNGACKDWRKAAYLQ